MNTKLLTVGNAKTVKGEKYGYTTGILHLIPSDLSGHNVCPMANLIIGKGRNNKKSDCSSVCLNLSGRARMAAGGLLTLADVVNGIKTNRVQSARMRKTRLFFEDRREFFRMLADDIAAVIRKAAREDNIPAFRLNGTSDLDFNTIKAYGKNTVMQEFPDVQFYDYTKIVKRIFDDRPANYHLTYSAHDGKGSHDDAERVLNAGGNVAVVFATARGKALPASWRGFPVIDGDATDLRFTDPAGTVAGLRAKGYAVGSASKFINGG